MKEHFEDYGYELPDGVEDVKAEGSYEYYKHQPGLYEAILGRLIPKYVDINGEKCEADRPGASISHFTNQWWITKYTDEAKTVKELLKVGDEKILIPDKIAQTAELYYPAYISNKAEEQWKVHNLLANMRLPDNPKLALIIQNPEKPTEKITKFKNFPFYYGLHIKFKLSLYKTGSIIVENLTLDLSKPRIEREKLFMLEEEVQERMTKEMASRENAPTEPPPSADALFNDENLGDYGNSTDDDLPF